MSEERRGLWRNHEGTREGKYLVLRRDGTVPEWPNFVMGAADPAAPAALLAYAAEAAKLGMTEEYVGDIEDLADEFASWRALHGEGDPDGVRNRADDPKIIEWMRLGYEPADGP